MGWIATGSLALLCALVLGYGLMRRGRAYSVPFLAAGMFLTFVLPQAPGLLNDYFLPQDMVARALFFAAACLAACAAGWFIGVRMPMRWNVMLDERRLLVSAACLSLAGAYFFYKFGQLSDEERLSGFLSGTAVAYLFFARLLTYGLAIAVLCFARRPSRLALAIILFDCVFYFERIVLAGRRGDMAEFVLILLLAVWFRRGWAVPRFAVLAGLALAMGGLLGAQQYRDSVYYTQERQWQQVLDIDLAENWKKLQQEGGPELRNLAVAMEKLSSYQEFDYGLSHWNSLVHSYVPAQIVGPRLKAALYIELPSHFPAGYYQAPGSTSMGMHDAFASFWYFGALKFLAIAAVLGSVYATAMRGNTVMQVLYMLSVMPSMLVVTHFTNEIVIAWVHITVFLTPVLLFSAVRKQARPSRVVETVPA